MRRIVLFMHTSLDGFVAGPKAEIDWILVDDAMFDYVLKLTDEADIALYGRVTYQMMESYWPTAAENPEATKHDIDHSRWYNAVTKLVISRTMQGQALKNTKIISNNLSAEITKLKQEVGKNIIIFGSPSVSYTLMKENLIDDYWLLVNPVLLGKGIPLFKNIQARKQLKLVTSNVFRSGVVCLHYENKPTINK